MRKMNDISTALVSIVAVVAIACIVNISLKELLSLYVPTKAQERQQILNELKSLHVQSLSLEEHIWFQVNEMDRYSGQGAIINTLQTESYDTARDLYLIQHFSEEVYQTAQAIQSLEVKHTELSRRLIVLETGLGVLKEINFCGNDLSKVDSIGFYMSDGTILSVLLDRKEWYIVSMFPSDPATQESLFCAVSVKETRRYEW